MIYRNTTNMKRDSEKTATKGTGTRLAFEIARGLKSHVEVVRIDCDGILCEHEKSNSIDRRTNLFAALG
jgi:hypothetical protein